MENNHQNLPEEIFTWLETRPFHALSPKEKQLVSAFFSPDEYQEIQQTVWLIKKSTQRTGNRKEEILDHLMTRFDGLYPPSEKTDRTISTYFSTWVWKAASFTLFACSVCLGVLLFQSKKEMAPSQIVLKDTLYQVKEVASPPLMQTDTIYLTTNLPKGNKAPMERPENKESEAPEKSARSQPEYFSGWQAQSVLPFEAIHNEANEPKNNSMKEDSLTRQFSFVTL